MTISSTYVGFERLVRLEWAEAALCARSGLISNEQLGNLINSLPMGYSSKRKVKTALNRLWVKPPSDLMDFSSRGAHIYTEQLEKCVLALTWGMALTTCPFFAKVTEVVGRLTEIYGDCTSDDIHRRMIEIYGDRDTTRRITNAILQSQENWGAILRYDNGKIICRSTLIDLSNSHIPAWIIEACLRYYKKPLSISKIQFFPLIFPFAIGDSLSYMLSDIDHLKIFAEIDGDQFVDLAH